MKSCDFDCDNRNQFLLLTKVAIEKEKHEITKSKMRSASHS